MKVTKPLNLILDTGKITSNVSEPDGTYDPSVWDTGASYAEGDKVYVLSVHKIYQNIYEGTTDNTVSSPEINVTETAPKWAEISYTNRWKMFDLTRSTSTYRNTNITITFTPNQIIESVAVLGMSGVTSVLITGTVGSSQVYNPTSTPYTGTDIRNYVVYDIPPSLSIVLTIVISGPGVVGCTHFVAGNPEDLGSIQSDITRDSINFSTVDRDTYGTATLVKRRSVPKVSYSIFTEAAEIERILAVRDDLNATTALWSGLDDDITNNYYAAVLILGFYRNFSITLDNIVAATINLELEEL